MTSSERRWLGLGLGLGLFSAAATAAVLSFGDGLFPVYRYATELAVEASRCPAPAGSEATIDYVCAEDLLAHGPLMLGARSPVLSCVFDLVALVGLAVATWRRREYFYVVVMLAVYLGLWGTLLAWNAGQVSRHADTGWEIYR
jgi:hypothetical protein